MVKVRQDCCRHITKQQRKLLLIFFSSYANYYSSFALRNKNHRYHCFFTQSSGMVPACLFAAVIIQLKIADSDGQIVADKI